MQKPVLGLAVSALEIFLKAISDHWLERKPVGESPGGNERMWGMAFLMCFPMASSPEALVFSQKPCACCVLSPQLCHGIPDLSQCQH